MLKLCVAASIAQGPPDLTSESTSVDTPQAPTSIPVQTVTQMIQDASARWGLNFEQMLRIATCESNLGQNPKAYDGSSGNLGVYQFSPSTWTWASASAGFAGVPATDDFANVESAHWLMKYVGPTQWSCK